MEYNDLFKWLLGLLQITIIAIFSFGFKKINAHEVSINENKTKIALIEQSNSEQKEKLQKIDVKIDNLNEILVKIKIKLGIE